MANQRPINRRPWRRPPWRTKRRPTRWNAVLGGSDTGSLLNTAVFPAIAGGQPPTSILVDGQVDVEPWADEQEVTLDRIVGSFSFHGWAAGDVLYSGVPYIKCGIVLLEELTDEVPAPVTQLDLFDQESVEDTEWMWLWAGFPTTNSSTRRDPNANLRETFQHTIEVDIKNRRKIGQKDQLAFYAQFALPAAEIEVAVQAYTDVRCILMSR